MMSDLRQNVIRSLNLVRAGERAKWLELFAEDAVVQDPVGKSPFDPTGLGHKGRAAIALFWDNIIARNERFDYVIKQSHICDREVASVATFTITASGQPWDLDLVTIHCFDENEKIQSIRAFWEFPN